MPTYRHKTIARFRIGEFEFKDHVLRTKTAEEDQKFQKLLGKSKRRTQREIMVVDEEAARKLERPFSPAGTRVQRGAQDTGGIETPSKGGAPRRPQNTEVEQAAKAAAEQQKAGQAATPDSESPPTKPAPPEQPAKATPDSGESENPNNNTTTVPPTAAATPKK